MKFDGKVVWIIGASAGIGAELARQMSARGSQLVLSARREAELEKVRGQCANADMHWVEPLDLGDSAGFEALVAKGMPTAVFVKKMLRELEKDKAEFVIAEGMASLGYHFHRLTPNLFHWALPRIYTRKR